MKYTALTLPLLIASACARSDLYYLKRQHARDVHVERGSYMKARWNSELQRREVPQEHSHEQFLTTVGTSLALNNPAGIKDPVFGLLGDAAGSAGQGSITDTDCLQQATADQAFTNAKAAGDVAGMTAALIYRALERNTGKVGLASVACTSIKAANPEIAAIQQHQDPASTNAAATNKAITLELAKQIASIGGTATDALKAGTFAPGNVNDPTAKGNSCDDQNDAVGCIFTQNLLVEDATVDEISAAVAGVSSAGNGTANGGAAVASPSTVAAVGASGNSGGAAATVTMMMTMTVTVSDCAVGTNPAAGAITEPPQAGSNAPPSPPSVTGGAAGQGSSDSNASGAQAGSGTGAAQGSGDSNASGAQAGSGTGAAQGSGAQAGSGAGVGTAEGNGSDTQTIDCGAQISSALSAAGMATASAPAAASTSTSASTGGASNTTTSSSSLDFGSCSNPTIIFANGLDGRNQPSFEPANTATFTHGSALNIKVITDFICQQLQSKCKASQATIDACNQGATAAQGASGQAAADAFNQALGF